MKFAHLADCHLGAWREPELMELSCKTFEKAIDICLQERVDFILIAGDLLNTSMPSVDILVKLTSLLKNLKDNQIPVYAVEGSHDYSPTGRTMLKVLEKAGLLNLVAKAEQIDGKLKLIFTLDEKTKTKITGIGGLKGSLEIRTYENLLREELEGEKGFKIFLFHSGILEFKPKEFKEMKTLPKSLLPKKFNYYAGGHIHAKLYENFNQGILALPGALFPTDIKELESYESSGFYILETRNNEINPKWVEIKLTNLEVISIDGNNKEPQQVEKEILKEIESRNLENKIVLLKISGTLSSGKPWELNMREISSRVSNKNPLILKINNKLTTREFQEIKIDPHKPKEEIEKELIKEHLGKVKIDHPQEQQLTLELMDSLEKEKLEDEVVKNYRERVMKEALKTLNLEEFWE